MRSLDLKSIIVSIAFRETKRVSMKSLLREICTMGSVRGKEYESTGYTHIETRKGKLGHRLWRNLNAEADFSTRQSPQKGTGRNKPMKLKEERAYLCRAGHTKYKSTVTRICRMLKPSTSKQVLDRPSNSRHRKEVYATKILVGEWGYNDRASKNLKIDW